MSTSSLHRLIGVLDDVCDELGISVDPLVLERTAVLIYNTMEQQTRHFHNLGHVYAFLPGADGVTALAALFHDLVYVSVDRGLPEETMEFLKDDVLMDGMSLTIRPDAGAEKKDLLAVFGFAGGQILPASCGQNEFLSALFLDKLLGRYLDRETLVATYACIEATIPFRPRDGRGLTPMEALAERLRGLGFNEIWIVGTLIRAVRFSNRDVGDFASEDTADFLTNTWKLLPEINPSLRIREHFDIVSYRKALAGMEGFFGILRPENIFQSFGGVPAPEELADLHRRTAANLAAARQYLQAKLLAMSLLEAAALISGGNAPISLFMGDIPTPTHTGKRLEDYLPRETVSLGGPGLVYDLLEKGRKGPSSFDLQNSPLGLFLYKKIPPASWQDHLDRAKVFFQGKSDPRDYLRHWDAGVAGAVLTACAEVVPTRKEVLRRLAGEFS